MLNASAVVLEAIMYTNFHICNKNTALYITNIFTITTTVCVKVVLVHTMKAFWSMDP